MKLSSEVRDIIARFVSKRPVPQGEAGAEFEDIVRQWSTQLAEQICFERPQDGFGKKRADPGRPISKDAIARQQAGNQLLAWDILISTGSGRPTLVNDPDSIDITGQVFVAVTPRNHLGAPQPSQPLLPSQPSGPPQPSQPAGPVSAPDLAAVLAAIQGLARSVQDFRTATDAHLADLANRLSALETRPAPALPPIPPVIFPEYVAPLPGGGAIVLKPRN